MKIVVLDGYTENPGDLSWEGLEKLGELTVYDRTSYGESPLIAQRIENAEVAVINKTPISKETIDACPNLKVIAVLATGYNVVDYRYAKERGIIVQNVPTYGTQIVGQYAVGLLLEICSHYGHHDRTVKEGRKLAKYVSLDDLFAQSDIIFLYCPLFPSTEGIINKDNIAKMRDGVILINNSRDLQAFSALQCAVPC